MSIIPYPVVIVPDPVLRQAAQPVERIDESVQTTLERMLATMYAAPGIGLAANQVGILRRFLVMDVDYERDGTGKNPQVLINPEVIWKSEEMSSMMEGCISIPRQFAEVQRPAEVRVKYQDRNGQTQEMHATGLLSHCVQHEIDHLNGVLFIDYLSSLKRGILLRKVHKLKRDGDVIL